MSNLNRSTTGTGANIITPDPLVHKTVLPVAGAAPAGPVVHEAEKVIPHQPLVEKQIINERPVEVKREHHIQPVVHETEHRIQPVIKTQATTEQPVIEKDKNIMEAPTIARAALPAGLEAVERAGPGGILHKAKLEKQVVLENPVEVRREHHVQPIIHEREHRVQPIIKTEATAEQTHLRTDKNVMHAPILERAALPAGMEAVERAGPEGILHKPKLAKDVVVEHPVQVKHEHHVQPIIHEREHHIQPLVKTEATAEQTHIRTDKNVMLQPIAERAALPAGLEAVERAGPEGVMHRAKMEKEILIEHPVKVKHERHIQPIIHEREHHIQPIVKTQVTADRPVIEQERDVLLPPIVEPTVLVGGPAISALPTNTVINTPGLGSGAGLVAERELGGAHKHKHGADVHKHKHTDLADDRHNKNADLAGDKHVKKHNKHNKLADMADPKPMPITGAATPSHADATTAAAETHHKASVGQKIKGALKEVQGTITRNPAKKEEGKMLMQGVDPATGASTTGTGRTGL